MRRQLSRDSLEYVAESLSQRHAKPHRRQRHLVAATSARHVDVAHEECGLAEAQYYDLGQSRSVLTIESRPGMCIGARGCARHGNVEPETIRALFVALAEERVDYVLVGAVAMDVLGIGRLTEDIDLFVRPTPDNIERLRRALRRVWRDPAIEEITAADLAGDYPAVQYVAPDGTPIDIMSRLGDAFAFDDLEASAYTYGDVDVRVATPTTLYRMKRDTVRLRDKADAQVLKEKFGLKE